MKLMPRVCCAVSTKRRVVSGIRISAVQPSSVIRIVEHADLGALGGGRAFARLLLRELLDERSLLPDLVVEHAIDLRRLVDADRGDRIALAMILGGVVLMGLGEAEAGRSCENRQQNGRCFR
jgi:hypothetical protein